MARKAERIKNRNAVLRLEPTNTNAMGDVLLANGWKLSRMAHGEGWFEHPQHGHFWVQEILGWSHQQRTSNAGKGVANDPQALDQYLKALLK